MSPTEGCDVGHPYYLQALGAAAEKPHITHSAMKH